MTEGHQPLKRKDFNSREAPSITKGNRGPAQLHELKQALHVSMAPPNMICREEEQRKVFEYCQACIEQEKGGSIYICGSPGTGKTLAVERVKEQLFEWAKHGGFKVPDVMAVNCTSVVNASEIFHKIVERFDPRKKATYKHTPLQHMKVLFSQKQPPSTGKMVLMIADEMDYLIMKDGAVLHDLFTLTTLTFSKFILIGIANTLDLADRFLQKFQSLNCRPMIVPFRAYTTEQIFKILQQRLQAFPCDIFQPQALELCARKVSAACGDMRKALSVCRCAVELLEAEVREPKAGLNHSKDRVTSNNKTRRRHMNIVRIDHMALALTNAFRSVTEDTIQSLPQHQQIIICSIVKLYREGKKNATIAELNKSYVNICKYVHVPPANGLEFSDMCNVLGDQGLVKLGAAKESRMKKVELRVDEEEVTFALQGVRFFQNCLQ